LNTNSKRGFALPVAIVFLTIFSIVGVMLVSYFIGAGRLEMMRSKLNDKQYAACMSGIRQNEFLLKYGSPAYTCTAAGTQTSTLTIDGMEVTITTECKT
jgi:hypothetical protein